MKIFAPLLLALSLVCLNLPAHAAVADAAPIPAAPAPAACDAVMAPAPKVTCTPAPAARVVTTRARRPAPFPVVVTPIPETHYAPMVPLTMAVGEIKLLPVPGKVTRVALGAGSVLSATAVERNLLLIAEKVGDTSLMVWSAGTVQSYRVQVVSKQLHVVREKVEALTANEKGIVLTQVGPDLLLSGIAHKETLTRLNAMLVDLPNVINNIQEDQGSSFTRSVLFRLTFVEVKRSLLESIGISWSTTAQGPTFGATGVATNTGIYNPLPPPQNLTNLLDPAPLFMNRNGSTGGVFFGLATTIASRINLGVNDGDARVLASPELTARSGGKARLQVGGEVPIPLTGAFGATTVEFKPYGIMFAIEPFIDAADTITAKLSTELSQIDPSVSVGGIPGFLTRNTATEISIKPGEVVALSGLINSELSTSIDRVPGLSRIPLFGRLFRSDDFQKRKTELVVFVEAEIIHAGDGLAAQLRERGQEARREFDEKVRQTAQPAFPPAPASAPAKGE